VLGVGLTRTDFTVLGGATADDDLGAVTVKTFVLVMVKKLVPFGRAVDTELDVVLNHDCVGTCNTTVARFGISVSKASVAVGVNSLSMIWDSASPNHLRPNLNKRRASCTDFCSFLKSLLLLLVVFATDELRFKFASSQVSGSCNETCLWGSL
jgi:hypothetical protein